MNLTNPTEHAIYAAAYVARLNEARLGGLSDERAGSSAIDFAESAVAVHRAATRRRKLS